jgi:hypothetical protein
MKVENELGPIQLADQDLPIIKNAADMLFQVDLLSFELEESDAEVICRLREMIERNLHEVSKSTACLSIAKKDLSKVSLTEAVRDACPVLNVKAHRGVLTNLREINTRPFESVNESFPGIRVLPPELGGHPAVPVPRIKVPTAHVKVVNNVATGELLPVPRRAGASFDADAVGPLGNYQRVYLPGRALDNSLESLAGNVEVPHARALAISFLRWILNPTVRSDASKALTSEMRTCLSKYTVREGFAKDKAAFEQLWSSDAVDDKSLELLRDLAHAVFVELESNEHFDIDWIVPTFVGHDQNEGVLTHLWIDRARAPVHLGMTIKPKPEHSHAMATLRFIQETVMHNLHLIADYLHIERVTTFQLGLMAAQKPEEDL